MSRFLPRRSTWTFIAVDEFRGKFAGPGLWDLPKSLLTSQKYDPDDEPTTLWASASSLKTILIAIGCVAAGFYIDLKVNIPILNIHWPPLLFGILIAWRVRHILFSDGNTAASINLKHQYRLFVRIAKPVLAGMIVLAAGDVIFTEWLLAPAKPVGTIKQALNDVRTAVSKCNACRRICRRALLFQRLARGTDFTTNCLPAVQALRCHPCICFT